MFCTLKKKKVCPAYVSKHNSNCEEQVILLMIPNGEKCETKSEGQRWHYLAVKKLSELLRGIASKNHVNFDCINWPFSFPKKKTNVNLVIN